MSGSKKNTVLIVDDENSNLLILTSILSSDYTIYTTKKGSSALGLADKYLPDIILLDILMPDMNGFDVLKALKATPKTQNIPVIIITGLDSVEDEEKGLDLGGADFIHKPFSTKIIMSRVRNQIQIVNQIRELEELQKELESAVYAAQTASRYKTVFLARMSHEIRSPLNVVLGLSESQLQKETLPQGIRETFSKIYSSGDLLLEILNDLLDMSKIEAGKLEMIPKQYNVTDLINDIAFFNVVKYENKPITFKINANENVPSILLGDDLRIKQIMNNLLSNAFKYTNTGTVELSIDVEKSAENPGNSITLIIRVRDSGQGMSKEQVEQLFEEYTRFNAEANRGIEGVGLGMSITHNLINMMHGRITVESEQGKGSLFTVRLPQGIIGAPVLGKAGAEELQQFRSYHRIKAEKAKVVFTAVHSGNILVVDDMEMNLYVAENMLSPYGMTVDTAISGPEAIEKIKSNTYDIVFMDHMMPGMSGIEATQEIRKLDPIYERLPIIALTADAVSGMRETFIAGGFSDFIPKPIRMQELNTIIQKWMPPEKILPETKKQ